MPTFFTFLTVTTIFTLSISPSNSCIEPTGFGTNSNEIDPATISLPDEGIYLIFARFITPTLKTHETPIQFRLVHVQTTAVFSTLSAFDDTSLDYFARETESQQRRRCTNNSTLTNSDTLTLYQRVTLAYTLYYVWSDLLYTISDSMQALLASYGIDASICADYDPFSSLTDSFVSGQTGSNSPETVENTHNTVNTDENTFDCSDLSTPWGLARIIASEVLKFAQTDGWNADGSLSREYNPIPYETFLPEDKVYTPWNSPWYLRIKQYWQPLRESDGLGFVYYQEHVTPHIGRTGKSYFLDNDEFCEFKDKISNPRFKYQIEIELLLDRMGNLNDSLKMEIEYFDDKTASLVPLYTLFMLYQGVSTDSFEFSKVDTIISSVLYEAVLVVWYQKVRWDRIRPPSIIHELRKDEYITTYAGTTLRGESYGTQTFLGDDFESYIRTMPHAEFPSASACLCEAFAVAMREITGTDSIVEVLGFPLNQTYDAYSSVVEPLSTPVESVTFTFETWTQVSERCGISRLNGGLHFRKSVPAGQILCQELGTIVTERLKSIFDGNRPDYVVDIDDTEQNAREC